MKKLILTTAVVFFSISSHAGQFEDDALALVSEQAQSLTVAGDVAPGDTLQTVLKDYIDLAQHVFGGLFGAGDEDEDVAFDEKLKTLKMNCRKTKESLTSDCTLRLIYLPGKGVNTDLNFKVVSDANKKPISIVNNQIIVSKK